MKRILVLFLFVLMLVPTYGGASRDNNEFILKQNTTYLIRFLEGNIAATNINWELDWYEHTNIN